jgi:HKD family nuclease
MALKATVLFDKPTERIVDVLIDRISTVRVIKVVAGFVTVEGLKALERSLQRNISALDTLIVGAGTYKAFEAFDELIRYGVPLENLFVHLGYPSLKKDGFFRYRPMLHSKIYYMENADGTACSFIGSHNMTGFALLGLNGEAGVMLEGKVDDTEFKKVKKHIEYAKEQAITYDPTLKEAFAWWTRDYFDALRIRANDFPKEFVITSSILVFVKKGKRLPRIGESLYLELSEALGVSTIAAEIHLFVFETLPSSPVECLLRINQAQKKFICKVDGIVNNKGATEFDADLWIENQAAPVLKDTVKPFRPNTKLGMQQIRALLISENLEDYEYLFGKRDDGWLPLLQEDEQVKYDIAFQKEVENFNLFPAESKQWYLVRGLRRPQKNQEEKYAKYDKAVEKMKPDSGSFILFSTARKKLKE